MKFHYFLASFLSLIAGMICLVTLVSSMKFLSGVELALEWEVGILGSMNVVFLIVLDWMSLFFISVVSLISGSVLLYSVSYMSADSFYSRFVGLVLSFIISMWILILSPNFISLLLGWDGLGVTSYLLVIYYQSEKSFNAGMITALTNRLGDAGLLILIGLTIHMGSWSFSYYSLSYGFYSSISLFLLILIAMTKSAQIPFSAWLPAAMAAPTPVSSLVHSSTLVTAGVYLLIRLNYLLSSMSFLWGLTLLGAMTMVMAGSAAMGEVDMKKIIALSTLSQLGLMFMTLGLGLPLLAFFHLVAHAYFKAMLFMCAGGVIHSMKEFQDLRTMGGSIRELPFAASIFLVANLSLCGIPFMTGFFSKDLILELMMMSQLSLFIFFLGLVATALTIFYSFRIFKLVFLSKPLSEPCISLSESDPVMVFSMMLLLLPSIFGGMMISWVTMSFNYLIFLPFWLKLSVPLIIIISSTASMNCGSLAPKTSISKMILFMWFLPLMLGRSATFTGLLMSKGSIYMDAGWNSYILFSPLKKLNSLSSNYLGFSYMSQFIKSVFFLLLVSFAI